MTSRTALMRSAAVGVLIAFTASAGAQAAPKKRVRHHAAAESSAQREMLQQVQALQAQVQQLQARLDARDQAPAAATQADVQQAQAQAAAAQAQVVATQDQLKVAQDQIAAAQTAIAAIPPAPTYKVAFDGAARITDGPNSFKVRGRLLLDYNNQHIDRATAALGTRSSQIRGRQAFLGVEGTIGPNWAYVVEGGAVNGGAWAWDDARLEYRVDPTTTILFGNVKAASIENITSQRFTSFLDRGPYADLMDFSYVLSTELIKTGKNWSVWAAVQGDSINKPDVTPAAGSAGNNERLGLTARATYAPINNAHTTLHLAGWYRWRKHGDDGAFTYASGYNSNLRLQTLLTTGAVGDSDQTFGVEGAWVNDSLSVQGEYGQIKVNRLGAGNDFDVKTGYAFVSFFPTGERRAYQLNGQFGRTRVLNPVDKDGFGALELLARYDYADASDALGVNGIQLPNAGKYNGVTAGLNWYPINYVRFMVNYTHGKFDNVGVINDGKVNSFQIRAQIDW